MLWVGVFPTVEEFRGGFEMSLSLELKTEQCAGLLLYADSSIHPDYFTLEMVNSSGLYYVSLNIHV